MASWLVTGGSSGIGLAIGRAVLKKGGTVVLTTRNLAAAQEAAPDVEKSGGNWLQLDFADRNFEQTVKDAAKKYSIDTLVNNAGYAVVGAMEDCSPESVRAVYEANVFAPIRMMQAVIPFFRDRKSGIIVNVGSSVSHIGHSVISVYGSTKAALRTVTEGVAGELTPFGIRTILLEPGRFRTNLASNGTILPPSETYKGTAVEQMLSRMGSMPPSPGNPDEAALRIYEIVTKTGMASGEAVRDLTRFPLGVDAHGTTAATGKAWTDLAGLTEQIATSTDFQE